mmetsp:Transcript_37170/g.44931  ORF Transcript_37170/g.44931 Transcript_37170/m.44931 type:complete len:83 (+) Transcript_37170:1242-1490(+)
MKRKMRKMNGKRMMRMTVRMRMRMSLMKTRMMKMMRIRTDAFACQGFESYMLGHCHMHGDLMRKFLDKILPPVFEIDVLPHK